MKGRPLSQAHQSRRTRLWPLAEGGHAVEAKFHISFLVGKEGGAREFAGANTYGSQCEWGMRQSASNKPHCVPSPCWAPALSPGPDSYNFPTYWTQVLFKGAGRGNVLFGIQNV